MTYILVEFYEIDVGVLAGNEEEDGRSFMTNPEKKLEEAMNVNHHSANKIKIPSQYHVRV